MKVLIIDDEPLVRRSLTKAFQGRGCECWDAVDGKAGLQLWRQHRPDLVFLDILMPGLTGPQVLQEIEKEIRDKTKVVMISAYTGDYNKDTALKLGADLFISKPFDDIFVVVETAQKLLGKS